MRRDYVIGIVVVFLTIILTILLWLLLGGSASSTTTELPVYVLIVDDFDGNMVGNDEEDENCVVDPSGSAFISGSGTAFISGSGTAFISGSGTVFISGSGTGFDPRFESLTHGEIVREVFEASVGDNFPKENIINVELDAYETTHAAERIAATIEEMGPAYYIVNMSFSIVPCTFVADLEEYALLFQKEGLDINELEAAFNEIVSSALETGSSIEDDPILDYIEQSCEIRISVPIEQLPVIELPTDEGLNFIPPIVAAGVDLDSVEDADRIQQPIDIPIDNVIVIEPPQVCSRISSDGSSGGENNGGVIFVAAAGNGSVDFTETEHRNIPFPFAPAIWDNVISISASVVIGPDGTPLEPSHPFSTFGYSIARYSNYGAIKMPSPYQGLGGTSFAAPRYAALLAMMLNPNTTDLGYTNFCLQQITPLPLPDSWERDTNINQPLC